MASSRPIIVRNAEDLLLEQLKKLEQILSPFTTNLIAVNLEIRAKNAWLETQNQQLIQLNSQYLNTIHALERRNSQFEALHKELTRQGQALAEDRLARN